MTSLGTETNQQSLEPKRRPLRYDEQESEEHYDDRDDADDDNEKGKLRFSNKLYGRMEELKLLHQIYDKCTGGEGEEGEEEGGGISSDITNDIKDDQKNHNSPSNSRQTTTKFNSPQVVYINGSSGVGKSALVQSFILERRQKCQDNKKKMMNSNSNSNSNSSNNNTTASTDFWYTFGKYSEQITGAPFSAIVHAINTWIKEEVMQGCTASSAYDSKNKLLQFNEKLERRTTMVGEAKSSHDDIDELPEQHSDNNVKTNSGTGTRADLLERVRSKLKESGFNCNTFAHEESLNRETSIILHMIPSTRYLLDIKKKSRRSLNNTRKSRASTTLSMGLRASMFATTYQSRGGGGDDDDGDGVATNTPGRLRASAASVMSPRRHPSASSSGFSYSTSSVEQISSAVMNFLQALTSVQPLVMFLDDLQWADVASLDLIQSLAVQQQQTTAARTTTTTSTATTTTTTTPSQDSPSLPNFLLIGSYRSFSSSVGDNNNNNRGGIDTTRMNGTTKTNITTTSTTMAEKSFARARNWFEKHIQELEGKDYFTSITLSNLSPRHLREWITSTLGMEEDSEEVIPLTECIYSKTLGNAFYVKQALEELVRKNVIYYNVITFEWTFNLGTDVVNKHQLLQDVLSADVVQMIQNKIETLSIPLQRALYIMSHIHHSVDLFILSACVKADTSPELADLTHGSLQKCLDVAVAEGLLYNKSGTDHYKFVHDKIQEAAYTSIPEGREKDIIKVYIAHVLTGIATFKTLGTIGGASTARYGSTVKTVSGAGSNGSGDNSRHQHNNNVSYNDKAGAAGNASLTSVETTGMHITEDENECDMEEDDDDDLDSYEWMLFVAVQHFNSVPTDLIPDALQLAKLNVQVANLCLARASFGQAVKLLRFAVRHLQENKQSKPMEYYWTRHYNFMLRLYNMSMETEFAAGNMEQTEKAIGQILKNATSDKDKGAAHHTKVALRVQTNNGSHELGVIESIRLLRFHGQNIPVHPTRYDLLKEKFQLQYSFGFCQSTSALADLPHMLVDDEWMMKLFLQLIRLCNYSNNIPLNIFVGLRAMRLSMEKGISIYLPQIIVSSAVQWREGDHYSTAYSYVDIVEKLYDRFPEDQCGSDYATGQIVLHSGILNLKTLFSDSIDVATENYRLALSAGNVDMAFAAAMHVPLLYIASGLPISSTMLEPKLLIYETKAIRLKKEFYVVFFQSVRQFIHNLVGRQQQQQQQQQNNNVIDDARFNANNNNNNNNHDNFNVSELTKLTGTVMDEDMILQELEGNVKRMTIRDISILRIALSFIFLDDTTMERMMERLQPFPLYDPPLVREHLRQVFHGMACFYVGRKRKQQQQQQQQYISLGRQILTKLKKQAKLVGPTSRSNAGPAVSCLIALDKNKRKYYDAAIVTCQRANILHLEAIMNEHCALMILQKNNNNSSPASKTMFEQYIGKAMWLYHDWGASTKVRQLRTSYNFLNTFSRRDAGMAEATRTIAS